MQTAEATPDALVEAAAALSPLVQVLVLLLVTWVFVEQVLPPVITWCRAQLAGRRRPSNVEDIATWRVRRAENWSQEGGLPR